MAMKIKDLKWNIEYDWDEVKKVPYSIMTCYHNDGTITQDRFDYTLNEGDFSEPYEVESDLDKLLETL